MMLMRHVQDDMVHYGILACMVICRYLEPALCIQMVGGMLDESSTDRLPFT